MKSNNVKIQKQVYFFACFFKCFVKNEKVRKNPLLEIRIDIGIKQVFELFETGPSQQKGGPQSSASAARRRARGGSPRCPGTTRRSWTSSSCSASQSAPPPAAEPWSFRKASHERPKMISGCRDFRACDGNCSGVSDRQQERTRAKEACSRKYHVLPTTGSIPSLVA